jgi:hypothetical protein
MVKILLFLILIFSAFSTYAYEKGILLNLSVSPAYYSEFKKEKGTTKSCYSGYGYNAELGYGFGRLSILGRYRGLILSNRNDDSEEKRNNTDYGFGARYFLHMNIYTGATFWLTEAEMEPYKGSDKYKFKGYKFSVDIGYKLLITNTISSYIALNFIPWANYNKKNGTKINRSVKELSYSLWLGLGVSL